MKLAQVLKLQELQSTAAGTQATVADSRTADEQIKAILDRKNKRLNDLRVRLNFLLGPEKGELHSSWRADRPSLENQRIKRVATGGKWAVVDPDGYVTSTWQTEEEAQKAAYAMWKGITPSSTGATAGARVKKLETSGTSEGASKGWDKRGRGHLHTAAFGKRVVTALSEAVPEANFKVVGSVAKQGYSRNDLDIRLIFKPAEDPGFDDEMHARFERALRKLGFTQLGQTDHGDVYTSTKARKLVIDFWFGEPTEDQLAFGDMAAVDVFSDPQLMEQSRKKFIKHGKPRVVKLADWLRDGDHRPSSAGSTAGTGGAGGPGG